MHTINWLRYLNNVSLNIIFLSVLLNWNKVTVKTHVISHVHVWHTNSKFPTNLSEDVFLYSLNVVLILTILISVSN